MMVRKKSSSERPDDKGMSTGKKIGVGLGMLAAVFAAANLKDLWRYIKISRM